MNPLIILPYIVFFSFVVITARNILYLTFLWQLKEYRFDRILAHLRTSQGRRLIIGPKPLIKWILFLGIFVSVFLPWRLNGYLQELSAVGEISYFLFWAIWIIEILLYIREFGLYGWRVPKFTVKIIFTLITLLILISLFLIDQDFISVLVRVLYLGPFVDRLIGLLLILVVFLFNAPVILYKKILIFFAKRKILSLKNLKVVGITGSYGKTSTKEFLTTLLGEKFKVNKTPEFTNTDVGIANYILKDLKAEQEVFVVEMGAYKKGEIKAICDMVKPRIGIITGINQQHLELFGSIENTMRAKFELIESLPKDGIAIFNGNNHCCLEMANWAKKIGKKVTIFHSKKDVKNIKTFSDHIEFTLIDKKKNYLMKADLLGEQTIENILAAVCAAKSLGMSIVEMQKGVSKIISPAKTMQFAGKKNGSALIDDTFNVNPDGVTAAVDYMKQFKGKKILVLTPLIELGNAADKIHAKIGEKVANICDLILLTNINYHKSFIDGAKKYGNEDKVQIVNTAVGTKLIQDNLDKGGVIVFEGKEAGRILQRLIN